MTLAQTTIACPSLMVVALVWGGGMLPGRAAAASEGDRAPHPVAPLAMTAPTVAQTPKDVSPDHWAYPALDRLVNHYGCVAGYPDGTFRGDQPITRYEFAAALNACLGAILELRSQLPSPELHQVLTDLNDLRQELGTLNDQVDTLDTSP